MSPMSPRLLRPRATGFSPKQINGLKIWYDVSNTASMTFSGSSVSQINDLSGNGFHATQATAADMPTYSATAANGMPRLAFDTTDSLVSAATVADYVANPTAAPAFTLLMACYSPTTANSGKVIFGSDVQANGRVFFSSDYSGNGAFIFDSTSAAGGRLTVSVTQPTAAPHVMAFYRHTADMAWRVDGAVLGSKSNASGTYTTTTAKLQIGKCDGGGLNIMYVSEVLAYASALTALQLAQVEGYLAWKWGLQASLPYDHPYAASFPGYGTQATPTDADALAYLSAVRTADGGTGVEVGVANAVDSFVKGCKSDGTWSAIKASCILAGARTLSGALVPLAGTAPTNVNFVAADYNRKTGLIGNGSTKYLNSNRLDNADSLNDVHLSTYVSAVTSAFKTYGGTQSHYIYRDNTDVYFLSRNATAIVGSSGSLTGLYGHSRAASGSFTSRVGGTTNTHSVASGLATGTNVYVFGRNVSDAIDSASNGRLAFYSIGSAIDLALLDTRVSALYTAIGAAI